MSDAIMTKLKEIGDQVKAVQDVNDRFQTKYDGLDLEVIEKNTELATKALEDVENLRQTLDAEYKARLQELELTIARSGLGTDAVDPFGLSPDEKKNYDMAYQDFMRHGIKLPDEIVSMLAEKQLAYESVDVRPEKIKNQAKDWAASTGPTGGYFILPERSQSVSKRMYETSPLRGLCTVVTTSSDTWETLLDDEDLVAESAAELAERGITASTQIGLVKIQVHENFVKPRATQRMLDDTGFDLAIYIEDKGVDKLSRKENVGFVSGTGIDEARGFLTYPAWTLPDTYERDKIEQISSTGTAGKLDESNDLITLQNSLPEPYQAGASFAMHRKTFGDVMKLRDDAGQYLLDPLLLKQGATKYLLGAGLTFMADMPVVSATALSVAYANWKHFYTIVDRLGIRVLRDPYSNSPYTIFYMYKRCGGAVTNFEAGKLLAISS